MVQLTKARSSTEVVVGQESIRLMTSKVYLEICQLIEVYSNHKNTQVEMQSLNYLVTKQKSEAKDNLEAIKGGLRRVCKSWQIHAYFLISCTLLLYSQFQSLKLSFILILLEVSCKTLFISGRIREGETQWAFRSGSSKHHRIYSRNQGFQIT